jgi:hypothetical protein
MQQEVDMTVLAVRRLTLFTPPVVLGIFAAIHPIVEDRAIPQDQLAVWSLIHTWQIPLAALLGVAILLLLENLTDGEARAARLAVVPWIAAFAAYDGVAGLATGALSDFGYAHPADAAIVLEAARAVADSTVVAAALPLMALFFGLVAFGGAAIALHRHGTGTAAAVALAVGGIAWTLVHPIVGAPAMILFAFGAFAAERRSVAATPATVPAVNAAA